MAWGVHNSGWWGEGEIKFFLDGDEEFPTICGTGTEDYFCGSYNFENQKTHEYQTFTTPIRACARSCARTASTARRRALASTAGTSRTPSPSPRTSA